MKNNSDITEFQAEQLHSQQFLNQKQSHIKTQVDTPRIEYGNPLEENYPNKLQDIESQDQTRQIPNITQTRIKKLLIIILECAFCITFTYPLMIFLGIYYFFKALFCEFGSSTMFYNILNSLCLICFSLSVLAVTIGAFFKIQTEKEIYRTWLFNAFLLFFTHIMIFTIIKMTKQKKVELTFANLCSISGDTLEVLILTPRVFEKDNKIPWVVDMPLEDKEWKEEYIQIMEQSIEVDIFTQRYNTLVNNLKHPMIQQYIGYSLIKKQNFSMTTQVSQFIILYAIALFKIMCCLIYFYLQTQVGVYEIIFILILLFFNLNEIHCLNLMLSNFDLRRKTIMISDLNDALNVSRSFSEYQNNLDITCITSIETWDNSRRVVLEMFEGTQKNLEKCYIYMFLYYLFTLNICLAAYGDIYLFTANNSVLLHPLMIISAPINFVFVNSFIFFRIYEGQKFNDKLDESRDQIENLISIFQDLSQMYDLYFRQSKIDENYYIELQWYIFGDEFKGNYPELGVQVINRQEDQTSQNEESDSKKQDHEECESDFSNYIKEYSSIYEIVVSKIKYTSKCYITQNQEFLGKKYDSSNESKLQIKILENILKNLKRVRKQIDVDIATKAYKLFGLFRLNFQDAVIGVVFSLSTLLPHIITYFLQQFQMPF